MQFIMETLYKRPPFKKKSIQKGVFDQNFKAQNCNIPEKQTSIENSPKIQPYQTS